MNWYKLAIKKVANDQVMERIKQNIRKTWPDQGDEIINQMDQQDWDDLIKEINKPEGGAANPKGFVETPLDSESMLGKVDQFFLNFQNKQFPGDFGKKVNQFLKNVDNLLGRDLGVDFYGTPINRV